MKKLNEKILLSMGFEKIDNNIYSLTINSDGLDLVGSNHIDEEFTLVGNDEKGFVLDGELEIYNVNELMDVIVKVMYNNGVKAFYSQLNSY